MAFRRAASRMGGLGILLVSAAVYLPTLGAQSVLWTGDQKAYLAIATEMYDAGHWWQPLFMGAPNSIKPPAFYLLERLSWSVFGFGLFGALFTSWAAWTLAAILLWSISRRTFARGGDGGLGSAAAMPAALLFLFCPAAWVYGAAGQMEALNVLWPVAGLWGLVAWPRSGEVPGREGDPSLFGWLIVGLVAALSALTKSPVYPALWLASAAVWCVLRGPTGLGARLLGLAGATLLACSLAAAGFLAMSGAVNPASYAWDATRWKSFWDVYVGVETASKGVSGNGGSVAGFWVAALWLAFPSILLLPWARPSWRALAFGLLFWGPALLGHSLHPYRVHAYLALVCAPVTVALASARLERVRALWRWVLAMGVLTLGTKFAAAGLGRWDLSGLQDHARRAKPAKYGVPNLDRSVWNEAAWLRLASGLEVRPLLSDTEVRAWLASGGNLLLRDSDSGLVCDAWERLPGREDVLAGRWSRRQWICRAARP